MITESNGLRSRYSSDALEITEYKLPEKYQWGRKVSLNMRNFKRNNKANVLIVGDSFAGNFINGIYENKYDENVNLSSWTVHTSSGNVFTNKNFWHNIPGKLSARCKKKFSGENYNNVKVIKLMGEADYVIFASAWYGWETKYMLETIENIKKNSNAQVLIIEKKHFGRIKLNSYLNYSKQERSLLLNKIYENTLRINNMFKQTVPYENCVDIIGKICVKGYCPIFTPNSSLISHDGGHLTSQGAKYIFSRLTEIPIISKIFKQPITNGIP